MTKPLLISHALFVPPEARKRHIAVLGMNGSGKTSVVKTEIVEPALLADERVCNIDPTGVGWGLRLARSGKSPAFKIYIVGGERQDFALEHRSGETWAEIVGTSSDSFIFDTSQMTVGRRSEWFKDFAEALIVKNKGPLYFVLDEAHLFAPQAGAQGGGIAPQMLHATNNLLSLGRSKGLRITMISQRPAKLHKDSLTQAHTLVAMMMTAPQDRAAVKEWIADQADAAKGQEIIASLPTLAPGEGWIWAPRERVLERVKFSRPITFDSSSAPDTEEGATIKLVPIDPETIVGRLAAVAQEKKANDPAVLRAQIEALNREVTGLRLSSTQEAVAFSQNSIDTDQAYRDGYKQGEEHGYGKGLQAASARTAFFVGLARDYLGVIRTLAHEATKAVEVGEAETLRAPPEPPTQVESSAPPALKHDRGIVLPSKPPNIPMPPVQPTLGPRPQREPAGDAKPSEQRLLDSVAFWHSVGHEAPSREQVAMVAGYKPSSGRFRNLIGGLRSAGVIEYPQEGTVRFTSPQRQMLASIMSREKAREILLGVLTPSQMNMAQSVPPGVEVPRQSVAEANNYEPTSGRFRNLIGSLRTLNIFTYPSEGRVALTPWAAELLR